MQNAVPKGEGEWLQDLKSMLLKKFYQKTIRTLMFKLQTITQKTNSFSGKTPI